MARMKVVLRTPHPKLGEAGEVVTVSGGYARNYLIPRGLAVAATKGNVKHADSWKQSKEALAAKEVQTAEAVKATLESVPLRISAQAGPEGQLFGSITAAQVAQAIADAYELDIDRHTIELPEPIRHLGFHEVQARLHADVIARVTVEAVEPDEAG